QLDDARRRRRHVERRRFGRAPGVQLYAAGRGQQPAGRRQEPQRPASRTPDLMKSATNHACGSKILNVVPAPGVDCTSISPSCIWTVRYTIDKPMPLPFSLVVK